MYESGIFRILELWKHLIYSQSYVHFCFIQCLGQLFLRLAKTNFTSWLSRSCQAHWCLQTEFEPDTRLNPNSWILAVTQGSSLTNLCLSFIIWQKGIRIKGVNSLKTLKSGAEHILNAQEVLAVSAVIKSALTDPHNSVLQDPKISCEPWITVISEKYLFYGIRILCKLMIHGMSTIYSQKLFYNWII